MIPTKGSRNRYEYLIDFLRKLESTDECIEWEFSRTSAGYGNVSIPGGTHVYVHRVAFHFAYGHWPTPSTLHLCDNPPCFNPRHLLEGTARDNSFDAIKKGRAKLPPRKTGMAHAMALLSDVEVREIRAAYVPRKVTLKMLAEQYNVSVPTIYTVVSRMHWKETR